MRITWPFSSRCAWMAGSQARNWVVVRSRPRLGGIGSAGSMKAIEPSGGRGRSNKSKRLYGGGGSGECRRWTRGSTGMSATSHAPNEGSAEIRHVTPAFASSSCASSTAFVRKPTGNCRPTVLEFRPRITSRSRSVSPMDLDRHTDTRKKMSLGVLAFFAFDLEPPRCRKFHAAFPEGLFRVIHVVLGRRDREDLRTRLHPRGRADGCTERRAHAFRDAVRPGPGRDLVLAEHVVRIEAKLEVIRVPGLLRDVPVRRDPRGLEGDVTNLAGLRGDEMDLHRELRPWIADVELADSDLRDAAHVLLAGVRLTADLAIHASGFASHGPRGARRSERYLILGGGGRFRCGPKRDPGGLAPSRPSSENHQEAQDGHGRSADQGGEGPTGLACQNEISRKLLKLPGNVRRRANEAPQECQGPGDREGDARRLGGSDLHHPTRLPDGPPGRNVRFGFQETY